MLNIICLFYFLNDSNQLQWIKKFGRLNFFSSLYTFILGVDAPMERYGKWQTAPKLISLFLYFLLYVNVIKAKE